MPIIRTLKAARTMLSDLYRLSLCVSAGSGHLYCQQERSHLLATSIAFEMNIAKRLQDDVVCLKSMWFAKGGGDTHAERLDNFYKPQAEECTFS